MVIAYAPYYCRLRIAEIDVAADGIWREDPFNPRKERNSFGDVNSLIEVTADESAGA